MELVIKAVNDQAEEVFKVLKKELKKRDDKSRIFADYFVNGRERGYTINKDLTSEISFAENRNSDDIVVYPFPWCLSESDDNYRKKSQYFGAGQYQKAAKFIVKYLVDMEKQRKV